jgi:branched-chain amino acid transport system permease protein
VKRLDIALLFGILLAATIYAHLGSPLLASKVLCYVLVACAFHLLYDQTGLLSFGHAAFWGMGGYTYALLSLNTSLSLASTLGASAAVTALGGVLVGLVSLKRAGIYFSMITLACAQIFYFVALKHPLFKGEDGLPGVPRGTVLGTDLIANPLASFAVVALVVGLSLLAFLQLRGSLWGLKLRALRNNELRLNTLGHNTFALKLGAFVLSAVFAGLAGALKVHTTQIVSLSDVHWTLSGEFVLMTLLGGLHSFWGPVIGAMVLIFLQNSLAGLGSVLVLIQGLLFILAVFVPGGLVGLLKVTRNR